MATYTPCGCEGVDVYVEPTHFEHIALRAGSQELPLSLKLAPDASAIAGGDNAIEETSSGFYVPENLQTLTAGDGLSVTGDGGSTPWNASVALESASGNNALSFSAGKLFAPGTIVSTVNCDEALSSGMSGLSAGAKHYSRTAFGFQTRAQSAFNSTSPGNNLGTTASLTNPSCSRSMSVFWAVRCDQPYFILGAGTIAAFNLFHVAFLTSGVTPSPSTVAQVIDRNESGQPISGRKFAPLTYFASGTIPPGDTLRVDATLGVDWNNVGGSINFSPPVGVGLANTAFSELTLRIEIFGSTT